MSGMQLYQGDNDPVPSEKPKEAPVVPPVPSVPEPMFVPSPQPHGPQPCREPDGDGVPFCRRRQMPSLAASRLPRRC